MVYRIFVEKKPGLDHEARALLADIRTFLGVTALTGLRILNRYDVENVDAAYAMADQVEFGNKYLRRDIGARALKY